jgi:hypothetical protein
MAVIGKTFRVNYTAKNHTSGLTDVRMVVYKPNGTKLGVFVLDEYTDGDAAGIYYYDFINADIEGVYLFVVDSPTKPLKSESQEYFHLSEVNIGAVKGIGVTDITDFYGVNSTDLETALDVYPNKDDWKADVSTLATGIQFLIDVAGGRWKIVGYQMIFYKDDNITEIMRFDLKDLLGNPNMTDVFERVRV